MIPFYYTRSRAAYFYYMIEAVDIMYPMGTWTRRNTTVPFLAKRPGAGDRRMRRKNENYTTFNSPGLSSPEGASDRGGRIFGSTSDT